MRIVAIGDIGVVDSMIHIGDEAMFEALVGELRRRDVDEIVGLSAVPAESAARYGIRAIAPIGFGFTGPEARLAMVDRQRRVLAAAGGSTEQLDADDPAWSVIDAIRSADGVAIAGGGNMASTWPLHIFERSTLGALALSFSKPLVISGQTIGPYLTDDDASLVADLLRSAHLVGVRERTSYSRARGMQVDPTRLVQTVDDASFLLAGPPPPSSEAYCAVTISTYFGEADRGAAITQLAAALDHVVMTTGLEIRFLAHYGSTTVGVVRGDSVVHQDVIAAMKSDRVRVVTPTDAIAASEMAGAAALAISSRYHPAVFAVAHGVPTIGIVVDDYTTAKLSGALGTMGQGSVMSMADLLNGGATGVIDTVWSQRDEIRTRTLATAALKRTDAAVWWDRVASTLQA